MVLIEFYIYVYSYIVEVHDLPIKMFDKQFMVWNGFWIIHE